MERIARHQTGGRSIRTQEFNGKTYHLYKGERYFSRGRHRLHRDVWEHYNGPIPEGYEIHHKDRNPENNDIANLVCIAENEHKEEHREEQRRIHSSPKALANLRRASEFAKEWHRSDEGRQWHREHGIRQFENLQERDAVCEVCGKSFRYKSYQHPRFCSNKCKSKWRRDAGLDNISKTCPVCGKSFESNRYAGTVTCSASCSAKYRNIRRKLGGSL